MEVKMKLPKKLSDSYVDRLFEEGKDHEWVTSKMFNQLIDYLSDKEGGEVKTGIPMGKHPIATKDCSVCKAKKGWIHLYEECTPKVACKSCGAEMIETEHYIGSKKLRSDFNCSKCGLSDLDKPQLKEESPKEDEWIDDLYENFSSHWDKNGRSLETFIRNILSLAQQRTEKKWRAKIKKAIGTKEPKGKITGEWLNDVLECCKGERNLFRHKMSDLLK